MFEKAYIFTVNELFMMPLIPYATDNIRVFSKAVKINTRISTLDLFEQKLQQIMELSIVHQSIKLLNCWKKTGPMGC